MVCVRVLRRRPYAPECRCKEGKWTSREGSTTSSPAASTSSGAVRINPRSSTPSKRRPQLRVSHLPEEKNPDQKGAVLFCAPSPKAVSNLGVAVGEVQRQEDQTSPMLMRKCLIGWLCNYQLYIWAEFLSRDIVKTMFPAGCGHFSFSLHSVRDSRGGPRKREPGGRSFECGSCPVLQGSAYWPDPQPSEKVCWLIGTYQHPRLCPCLRFPVGRH